MTRAAIYCRVSTPGQEEDGTSLQTQEERCRAYIAEHGYALDEAHVYRDVHSGAELDERPQLTALRGAMAGRTFDVVVTYAVDRLSRDQIQLAVVVYEADRTGVALEFVTEVFDATPTGRFIRSAQAFVGEVERAKIKERTMRGKRARSASGKLLRGCRPLYGYRFTEDYGAYVVDPLTGPIVERIFAEATMGRTLRGIAQGLTDDHVATPSGRVAYWWPGSVRWILRNPTYTGEAFGWRYMHVKDAQTGARSVQVRAADEQIALPPGTIPALVDAATFAAVQETMAGNKLRAVRNNREPELWLLRGGYVRCGHCGYAMQAKRRARGTLAYACPRNTAGRGLCSGPQISADILDAAVWTRIEAMLTDPDVIANHLADLQANDPTEHDARTVERQIADVRRRHETTLVNLGLMAMSPTSAQRVGVQLAELEAEEQRLHERLDAIRQRRETWEAAQERLTDLQAWCEQVADRLGQLTYEQRRLALDYLAVEARVFGPDRYEITASVPLDGSIVKRTPSGSSPAARSGRG